jgi:hypothetical protein
VIGTTIGPYLSWPTTIYVAIMQSSDERISRPTEPGGLVLEAWGQGIMVGSLVVMGAIIVANMKSHVLLHKLILAEVSPSKSLGSSRHID